jgi:hypothetical protein
MLCETGMIVKLKGNVNRDQYLFCGTVDRLSIEGGGGGYNAEFGNSEAPWILQYEIFPLKNHLQKMSFHID